MEFVYDLLVMLHFLGLASLVGGCLVQLKSGPRKVNAAMVHGAFIQIVTGVAMVGLAEGVDELGRDPDTTKIAVKLLVALVVAVLAWANRKAESIADGLFFMILGLSVANIAVAVFW